MQSGTPSKKVLIRSGLIVALGFFIGRLLGFARELILAKIVGVSEQADLAVLVLTYPDVLMVLLAGAAISSAFIPEIYQVSETQRRGYFWKVFYLVTGLATLLCLVLLLFTPYLTWLLAPGLDYDSAIQASRWLALGSLAIPILAATAVTRCFLQAENNFTIISLQNSFNNVAIIAGLLLLYPLFGLEALAYIVLLGALFRLGPQMFWILRLLPPHVKGTQIPKVSTSVMRRYLEAFGALTIHICLPLVGRSFGSLEGDGHLALFNYAYKVIELPGAIISLVFSWVLLPRLSEAFISKSSSGIRLARAGFISAFVLSVVIGLYLAWFLWGVVLQEFPIFKIKSNHVAEIAWLAIIGLIGLPAKTLLFYLNDVMSALKDTRSGFLIALACLVASIPLVWWSGRRWDLPGIFAAIALVYWVAWWGALKLLARKHQIHLLGGFARSDISFFFFSCFLPLAGFVAVEKLWFIPLWFRGALACLGVGLSSLYFVKMRRHPVVEKA